MPISKTLHVTNRDEWRAWLVEHHTTETEVWLIYFKKQSGQDRIPYDEAVEEALCFGWIDSIVKRIDEDQYAQKFTPRRDYTKWSRLNQARMRKLVENGRMTEFGLAKYQPSPSNDRPPGERVRAEPEPARFVEEAFAASPTAWKNFQALPPSHRRNYLGWIMAAKREETRLRRLQEAVSLLEQNKKLGLK
jgi:uncharacterized protein YdeI (YjbR/CyaY-like superfamily)